MELARALERAGRLVSTLASETHRGRRNRMVVGHLVGIASWLGVLPELEESVQEHRRVEAC